MSIRRRKRKGLGGKRKSARKSVASRGAGRVVRKTRRGR